MQNITKIEREHFEIRFSYKDRLSGKRMEVRRRVVGSLKDARTLRDELKEQARLGTLQAGRDVDAACGEYVDDYLASRKVRLSHSGYETEKIHLEYVRPWIESWLPSAITARDLERLIVRWCSETKADGQTYSRTTVKNRVGVLRRFLKYIFKEISKDCALLVELEVPTTREVVERKGRALSAVELRKFLAHFKAEYPQHYFLLFLLIVTGQRWGSVTALRSEDMTDEWITFATSHYRGVVRKGNKSGKIVRLPMTTEIREVWEWHKAFMKGHINAGLGLLFPTQTPAEETTTNGFQVAAAFRSVFRSACEALKIPKVTPHDLRRSFNTLQIESGLDGTILRSITAHSSSAMTDHYYHGSVTGKAAALANVLAVISADTANNTANGPINEVETTI